MADLKMIETGNGGDLVLNGNDLQVIEGWQNMPYLGMFGGNVEASTTGPKISNEEALDWWANNLLMQNEQEIQLNSTLEKALNTIPLTSSGRNQIRQAVIFDLGFMTQFGTLTTNVYLTGVDRVRIDITFQEPFIKQSTTLIYLWDGAKNELTTDWDNEII